MLKKYDKTEHPCGEKVYLKPLCLSSYSFYCLLESWYSIEKLEP